MSAAEATALDVEHTTARTWPIAKAYLYTGEHCTNIYGRADLQEKLDNPAFVVEGGPWFDSSRREGVTR